MEGIKIDKYSWLDYRFILSVGNPQNMIFQECMFQERHTYKMEIKNTYKMEIKNEYRVIYFKIFFQWFGFFMIMSTHIFK